MFAEWTIKDQLKRINLFEIAQARTEKGGVEEKDVELKDNAMPSPLKVVYQVPVHKGVSQGAKGQEIEGFMKGQEIENGKKCS